MTAAFHLPLLDHVHELNAAKQDACTPKGLESEHRSSAPLDCSVILFDNVVQILVLADPDRHIALGVQRLKRGQI